MSPAEYPEPDAAIITEVIEPPVTVTSAVAPCQIVKVLSL